MQRTKSLSSARPSHPERCRQRHRMRDRFLQEPPTVPPTTERPVSAAADVGSQNLNGSNQS